MTESLLLILAMKYNFYWLYFCSLLAKAEPVAMASSGSTGDTGGEGSQWSFNNTGYWNHPFYGSYESWHTSHKSCDKPDDDAWKDDAWWAESGWKGSWWEKESGDGHPDVDMSGTNTPATGAVMAIVGATPKHKAHPPTASSSAHGNEMSLENDIKKCAIDWPPTMDDEEWEEETEAAIHAKSLFWVPEKLVRLHTGALTPFEVHQLRESYPLMIADVTKVISHFGEATGPTRAARTVLKNIAEAKSMIPGTECSIDTPEFSLCKHLLLAAWNGFPKEVKDCGYERCNCFPRTSIMPRGCPHKGVALWKQSFYYNTFCQHCSECLRCGGPLGKLTLHIFVSSKLVSGIGAQEPRTRFQDDGNKNHSK